MDRARMGLALLWRTAMTLLLVGAVLFGPAGTFDYWQAWLNFAVYFLVSLVIGLVYLWRDPDLLARRMQMRQAGRRQRRTQYVLGVLYVLIYVVAGLDRRWGLSHVPVAVVLLADALVMAGFVLVAFVFEANRFAASTLVVEPQQTVAAGGPYAFIRHPMYLAGIVILLSLPMALGSFWALIPAAGTPAGLIVRIKDEEALLTRDLRGYDDYRRKVRWRLIPGLW